MCHLNFKYGAEKWGKTDRYRPDHRYLTPTKCAYCEVVAPAGSKRYVARVSYGWANNELLTFCSRRCRGFYRERGPKWNDRDRDRHPGPNRTLSEFSRSESSSSPSASPAVATTAGP